MRGGAGQLDMAHAFTSYLGQGDFDATFFADYAAVLEALVLAAQALVVFYRAEDAGAEQTVALGLEGSIVNGFWLFHFTK